MYERTLAGPAATITDPDLDVPAVPEVGDPQTLDELVALPPGRWHRMLSEHPDGRGIRVGFVSRFAFADTADIVGFPAATAA